MSSKMVDLAVYINPDFNAEREILRKIQSEMKDAQSINQTMFRPLRMAPIVLSIETKTPFSGGETADVQLATWAGAGLTRLRQMLPPSEPIPTIPILSWHGHHLHLMGLEEQAEANIMYGKLPLGNSHTLLGIFQMIKGIEILLDWANTEYREWFFDNIIRPD